MFAEIKGNYILVDDIKKYSDIIHYYTLLSTISLQNFNENSTMIVQVLCIEDIFYLGPYVVPRRYPHANNICALIQINFYDCLYHV